MTTILSLTLAATNCNGYPKFKVFLDNELVHDIEMQDSSITVSIEIDNSCAERKLEIERYGKTWDNMSAEVDQILEIKSASVDNTAMPEFILYENSIFEFDGQKHEKCLYFGPNGVWTFSFSTPLITWVLDKKIQNEAKYSDVHLLPFSYKINPNIIEGYIQELEQTLDKIKDYKD